MKYIFLFLCLCSSLVGSAQQSYSSIIDYDSKSDGCSYRLRVTFYVSLLPSGNGINVENGEPEILALKSIRYLGKDYQPSELPVDIQEYYSSPLGAYSMRFDLPNHLGATGREYFWSALLNQPHPCFEARCDKERAEQRKRGEALFASGSFKPQNVKLTSTVQFDASPMRKYFYDKENKNTGDASGFASGNATSSDTSVGKSSPSNKNNTTSPTKGSTSLTGESEKEHLARLKQEAREARECIPIRLMQMMPQSWLV